MGVGAGKRAGVSGPEAGLGEHSGGEPGRRSRSRPEAGTDADGGAVLGPGRVPGRGLGWGLARRRNWRRLSGDKQVEVSTRWVIAVYPWAMFLGFTLQLPPHTRQALLPHILMWLVLALSAVQCVMCARLVSPGIDRYLGTGGPSRRQVGALVVSVLTATLLTVTLTATDAVKGSLTTSMVLYGELSPCTVVLGLLVPPRRCALIVAVYTAVTLTAFALASMSLAGLLATAGVLCVGSALGVFTGRSSAWYVSVMRKLDKAKQTQARLAVAEERLRFGRDLHDVVGRNLSAIALKSELAVQLAQRAEGPGSTAAAVRQMSEVQRIARESQSEVRAVVRGYREAVLATELAGARGVLRAAGVECRIDEGDGGALPQAVQAALGWVVREGATNVLRHADASRCTVRLSREKDGSAVRLVLANDGVRARSRTPATATALRGPAQGAPSSAVPGAEGSDGSGPEVYGPGPESADPGGSGLLGLRERLAELSGTLRVECGEEGGEFRLTARVPLGGRTAEDAVPEAKGAGR